MLVYLHRYREEDSEMGGESVDQSTEEYFGTGEMPSDDEWKRISHGDRTLLRKAVTYDGVTRLSVPEDVEEPRDLPGLTIQLDIDGETEYVDDAEVIEVTDENP